MVSLVPFKSSSFYFCCDQFQRRCETLKISGLFYGSSIASRGNMGSSCQRRISSIISRRHWNLLMGPLSVSSAALKHWGVSSRCNYVASRLVASKLTGKASHISWSARCAGWVRGGVSAGIFIGICLCLANIRVSHAEAAIRMKDGEVAKPEPGNSLDHSSNGKAVYTNYSITGIPGDGRCLFCSVAHGACLVSGKPLPNESVQRELADELRNKLASFVSSLLTDPIGMEEQYHLLSARSSIHVVNIVPIYVAGEFIKRRKETEWFVEGDFDSYISQIRKPYVWGGEPELLMASHVLELPITVYMYDENARGLIAIAEYGQEYGKKPIQVLYHGFGHYDALQIHQTGVRPRL